MAEALQLAVSELGDAELVEALVTALAGRDAVFHALVEYAPEAIFLPASVLEKHRFTGVIKSFSALKGYGFITCPELQESGNADVFLHGNKIGSLGVGAEVNFAVLSSKDGKLRAFDVIAGPPETNGNAKVGEATAWKGKGSFPSPMLGGTYGGKSNYSGKGAAGFGYASSSNAKGSFHSGFGSIQPAAKKGAKGANSGKTLGGSKGPTGSVVTAFESPGITDQSFEGIVKSFNATKGFGFISSDQLSAAFGEPVDAFLHKDEIGSHEIGAWVTFTVILSKDGRPRAQNVNALGGLAKRPRLGS